VLMPIKSRNRRFNTAAHTERSRAIIPLISRNLILVESLNLTMDKQFYRLQEPLPKVISGFERMRRRRIRRVRRESRCTRILTLCVVCPDLVHLSSFAIRSHSDCEPAKSHLTASVRPMSARRGGFLGIPPGRCGKISVKVSTFLIVRSLVEDPGEICVD